MPQVSITEGAAINRLASRLAPVLTNPVILGVAKAVGLSAEGSNKHDRISSLLFSSCSHTPLQRESLIATLVMQAHSLHLAGKAVLTEEDVDAIVADIRELGLRPGELAKRSWRSGLAPRAAPSPPPQKSESKSSTRESPRRHEKALARISELTRLGTDPQSRGRELEVLAYGVLREEGLDAERNIVTPGEQIDVGFIIDGAHYLLECKWENSPVGFPTVEHFMGRVLRKAEGTFGVLLSMSGFVKDINEKASRGQRLNCVGIGPGVLLSVVEGRATWASVVREARRLASTRSYFTDQIR